MPLLSLRPPDRIPHNEPGFYEPEFVAEYGAETGKFPVEFEWVLSYLANYLAPNRPAKVLEIGPGPGWLAILLAKANPAVEVTGIDLSPAFVELAGKNCGTAGVSDRVRFTVGDAATMAGLADHTFDVVMSHQSLHYWNPPERVFDQISRVLKTSGVFCISDDRRDMNWRGKLQVFLGRCALSRRIGSSWGRSVVGCLTVEEATAALSRSALESRSQISVRPRMMLIHSAANA